MKNVSISANFHFMNVSSKWKLATGCAVLLSAAALLSAVPASADPPDDAFIAALAKDGIGINDRNTALAAARTVCDDLENNQNTSALATSLKKDTNLSLQQTSYFVGASISAYCPQYIGHTNNSPNWLKPIYPVSVW